MAPQANSARLDRNRDNVLSRAEVVGSTAASTSRLISSLRWMPTTTARSRPWNGAGRLRSFYQQDSNDDPDS